MDTITIGPQELKKMMRETFIDVILTTRKDLVEEAVIGAIEGISLKANRPLSRGNYPTRRILRPPSLSSVPRLLD